MTATLAEQYWRVVEDCLVEFHGLSRVDAASCVTAYLRRLSDHMASLPWNGVDSENQHEYGEIIYHGDPWYIACDLAQREIPIARNETAYKAILRRHQLA